MSWNIKEIATNVSPALLQANRPPATSNDVPDESLIERIAAGDRFAMKNFYRRHNVRVYRFILNLIKNHAIAEDLVSEVFLDVWIKAAQFEYRSRVLTWLFAIARNKTLEAMRQRTFDQLDSSPVELIEDPAEDAEVIVGKQKMKSILLECLAGLSPAHRQIIDLVYYHGRTISDIALILGIEQSTVKTRMFYARQRLADLLLAQGVVTALG
jgi:RNA polymerase sigma-70 factor (ECF subfamily)